VLSHIFDEYSDKPTDNSNNEDGKKINPYIGQGMVDKEAFFMSGVVAADLLPYMYVCISAESQAWTLETD